MKLKERVLSPTPKFFKSVRTIGIVLLAISGSILTSPAGLPAALISLAGYAGVAGGVMSAISQLTVENPGIPPASDPVKPKPRKKKAAQ